MKVSTPTSARQNPILETVQAAKRMGYGSRYSLCESAFDILSLKPGLKPSTHPRHTDWDAVQRYHGYIQELEQEAFPGEINRSGIVNNRIVTGLGHMFSLFGPSCFFQPVSLIISEAIVADLRDNNKSMLSVGCGPAHLERFLVSHLGIARRKITLADIDGLHVPQGFNFRQFDMLGTWPHFDHLFDYIIFPESIMPPHTGNKPYLELYHIFNSALAALNPGGQIRATFMDQTIYEPFEEMVKSNLPGTTTGLFTTMVFMTKEA